MKNKGLKMKRYSLFKEGYNNLHEPTLTNVIGNLTLKEAEKIICSWYLLWFIYPNIINNILSFINSPRFIWFLSIIFVLSFIYLIYLIIKEGFNKETLLKFWRWTDKTIIVRFCKYSHTFYFFILL